LNLVIGGLNYDEILIWLGDEEEETGGTVTVIIRGWGEQKWVPLLLLLGVGVNRNITALKFIGG
jgi:hypothetical protein